MMPKAMNRRKFLKASAASAVGAGLAPNIAMGQSTQSANDKLNIAMIGAGNIAGMAYGPCSTENLVAIADVDEKMMFQKVDEAPQIKKAKKFKDFRVMLDKMGKHIDAVCINTPDHTHFVATIAAMERGIHVITQKPLTHNIWEAQTLQKAKHKYNVVTNMAVQGHTYPGIRQMREWVEADVFGQITEIHSWRKGPPWRPDDGESNYWRKPSEFPPPATPKPSSLDWDLWKGPVVTDLPYSRFYHPSGWRGHYAFGNGLIGDWMVHIADGPVWILDLYDPVAVELEWIEGGNKWIAPDASRVRWDFERRGDKKPCTFYWHHGPDVDKLTPKPENWSWGDHLPDHGTLYFGDKQIGYTDERSNKPRLASREDTRDFKRSGYPDEKYPRVEGGPYKEWIRAIKQLGPEPGANFDYATPFTVTALLGALVTRFGGRIEWDPVKGITNRPELNTYIKPEVVPGWEYGNELWT
ncbi:Gfo/Idh/MocA family protein [Algisphaera agarilytica]|uniref:Putative dehydrogenase n=1 Tax=Algisphaera agarilytica TaxID=1385975 RepID=A0A7X0H4I0_9BACT|nr:Gfo/Idh/MocA family oxidoreductase [Algisphaera agarilytica]MBB6429131.1 putative dehydrogenase [Algisphaera agarilytica]